MRIGLTRGSRSRQEENVISPTGNRRFPAANDFCFFLSRELQHGRSRFALLGQDRVGQGHSASPFCPLSCPDSENRCWIEIANDWTRFLLLIFLSAASSLLLRSFWILISSPDLSNFCEHKLICQLAKKKVFLSFFFVVEYF